MDLMNRILNALGHDPVTQGVLVLTMAVLGSLWWFYSKYVGGRSSAEARWQASARKFYAPAYGLILGRVSGSLPEDVFQSEFRALLAEYGSTIHPAAAALTCRWLAGSATLDELAAGFEEIIVKGPRLLRERSGLAGLTVKALWWAALTGWSLLFLLMAIPVIFGLTLWVLGNIQSHLQFWFLGTLTVIAGAGLLFRRSRGVRETQ